jgi:hypothetical protein
MKAPVMIKWMLLIGTVAMLAGCDSYKEGYDRQAASVNPAFPPAAPTPENAPGMYTTGAIVDPAP